jgi:hypothetical protein
MTTKSNARAAVSSRLGLGRLARLGACAAAGAFLTACPNPNLYTVPRTLDPGAVQVQIAPEVFGASFNGTSTTPTTTNGMPTTSTQTVSESIVFPMVPTVGVRVGVADGVEVGARIPNLDSVGADVKVRLLKGSLDLAVDPGLQGFYFSFSGSDNTNESLGILYLHLPLLVGFNLSKSVSIVASPGVAFAIATASASGGGTTQQVAGTSGFMGRIGVGLNLRTSKKFSIQPEVTIMKAFADTDALMYVIGLGFNIGAQPDYSDLDPASEPPPQPAAAAAPAAAASAPAPAPAAP